MPGRKPSPTTMPPFFGFAKSSFLPKNHRKLLYQRTTGSSKRITMCSTNIPGRTQMQFVQFRPRTKDLYREAQIVQSNIRQQESYRSVIGTHNRNSTLYNLSDRKKVSESPGPQAIQGVPTITSNSVCADHESHRTDATNQN
jgi:hypothetical protein